MGVEAVSKVLTSTNISVGTWNNDVILSAAKNLKNMEIRFFTSFRMTFS